MSNNLSKFRGQHGLTQEQLGEKLGISKAAVCFIEKNNLSPEMAQKCSDILGENRFSLMGTDALKALPKTQEEKDILIETIKNL